MDYNGKQVLNFQLSLLLYSLILIGITIPIFISIAFQNISFETIDHDELIFNNFISGEHIEMVTAGIIAVLLFVCLKIAEFFLIIYAAIKTSNGELFKYPLSIPFIK